MGTGANYVNCANLSTVCAADLKDMFKLVSQTESGHAWPDYIYLQPS